MSLTILSGSPKSGKTRQAYLLAAKVAETGKVLIFTDDDISTLVGRSSCLVGDTWLSTPKPDNIYFNRLFSLSELEDKIEKIKPELVVIDAPWQRKPSLESQLEKFDIPILLVRNTLAVLDH
jgi:hypothetical protein